jgi:hypothetical protein
MSLLIKGESNPLRIALDSSWEMAVGSSQTALDMWALRHFAEMAARRGNAKLRFLGWAVAIIDQGLGYAGYSLASQAVESVSGHKKAEGGTEKAKEETSPAVETMKDPRVKLVPIFSEE